MTLPQIYQSSSSTESLGRGSSSGAYTGANSGNQCFHDPLLPSYSGSEINYQSNQAGIFSQKIELFITRYHQIHKPCVRHNNLKYHQNPTIFTNPLKDQREFIKQDEKIKKTLLITEENVSIILIREGPIKLDCFLKYFEIELIKSKKSKKMMILILKEISYLNKENQLILNQDEFEKKYNFQNDDDDHDDSSSRKKINLGFFKVFEPFWVFWWIISVFMST
ncbi:hypothetical protein DFH28DRAFT_1185292 [Melampsora americana]|nr:hypothetical protein DFH28DRAFT_1185292 [Melampsora americana]